MVILTYSGSLNSISCRYCSTWRHPNFDGLSYPVVFGTPNFFPVKMTTKDELEIASIPRVVSFAFVCERKKKSEEDGDHTLR